MLRILDSEPLLIDHDALMRAVIQAPATPTLLIGDVGDCDWRELGAALVRKPQPRLEVVQ